jgi:hypothetical protein
LGEPARDERGFLDECAAERRLARQNRLCASTYRIDNRHRRNTAQRVSRGGQLPVADDGQVPAARAVRTGRDHLVDAGQCAQPLAAPEHVDGNGGVIP